MNQRLSFALCALAAVFAVCFTAFGGEGAVPTKDFFTIDYSHEAAGASYHGTLSFVDDKVTVLWTTEDKDGKKLKQVAMTEDTFRSIWESFNTIADFRNSLVKDDKQKLDFRSYHVVGIAFKVGGQSGIKAYMIPTAGVSSEFKKWLEQIGYAGP